MTKANCIKFQLLQKLEDDKMICLQFKNCIQYQDLLIPTQLTKLGNQDCWSVTLEFLSSPNLQGYQAISYKYVVVSRFEPKKKLYEIFDIETRKPMELSFKRRQILGNYVEILDRSDHQWTNQRIVSIFSPEQIVCYTVKLIGNDSIERVKFDVNNSQGLPKVQIFDPQSQSLQQKEQAQIQNKLIENDQKTQKILQTTYNLVFRKNSFKQRKSPIQIIEFLKRILMLLILLLLIFLILFLKFLFNFSLKLAMLSIEASHFVFSLTRWDLKKIRQFSEQYVFYIKLFYIEHKFYRNSEKSHKFQSMESLSKLFYEKNINHEINQNPYQINIKGKRIINGSTQVSRQDVFFIFKKTLDNLIDHKFQILDVLLVVKGKGVYKMQSVKESQQKIWTVKLSLHFQEIKEMRYFFQINTIQINDLPISSDINLQNLKRKSLRTCVEKIFGSVRNDVSIYILAQSDLTQNFYQYYPYIEYDTQSIIDGKRQSHSLLSLFSSEKENNVNVDSLVQNSTFFIENQPLISNVCYYNPLKEELLSKSKQPKRQKNKKTVVKAFKNLTQQQKKQKTQLVKQSVINEQVSIRQAPKVILKQVKQNNIIKKLIHKPEAAKFLDHLKSIENFSQEVDIFNSKIEDLLDLNPQSQIQKEGIKQTIFSKKYLPIPIEFKKSLQPKQTKEIFKNLITQLNPQAQKIQSQIKQFKTIYFSTKQISNEIIANEVQILSINIILEAKLWGKNSFLTEKITHVLQKFLPQKNQQSQIRIVNIIYYLNKHCHQKQQYTHKVSHRFQPQGHNCQNTFQKNVQNDISLIRSGKQRSYEFVENDDLYKLLVLMVDSDIDGFIDFGKQQGIMMQTDEISTNLMRVLINYATIYCLGKMYEEKMGNFNSSFCAQFDPFCQQNDKRFHSSELLQIRDKYQQLNKKNEVVSQEKKNDFQKAEKKVQKILQNESNREIMDLVVLNEDVQKMKSLFLDSDAKKLFFQDDKIHKSYQQGLKAIDQQTDYETKKSLLNALKNHQYIKIIGEFYN